MPKLIVATQYHENYGHHLGADGPWKAKGGEEYVLARLDATDPLASADRETLGRFVARRAVEVGIEYANPASRETVIAYRVVSDNWMSDSEADQLEFDGKITSPTKDFTNWQPKAAA